LGLKIIIVSDLTLKKLEEAPYNVRRLVKEILGEYKEFAILDDEATKLARHYIEDGAVTEKYLVDAQHIAIAAIQRVDVLVSWNQAHCKLDQNQTLQFVTVKWVSTVENKKSTGDTMKKECDAVKMMREIRDTLSKKYTEDPEAEKKDLEEIRKKYGINNVFIQK
jgi:hypothetical protein